MAKTKAKAKAQKRPEGPANHQRSNAQKAERTVDAAQRLGKRKRGDASQSELGSSGVTTPVTIPLKKSKQNGRPATVKDSSENPTIENPALFASSTPEIPNGLLVSHNVVPSSINSGTQIQKKVKRILEILGNAAADAGEKPAVVMLYAKAPATSKMISIVEISKRELSKDGDHWYQYNGIEALMVAQQKKDLKIDESAEASGAKDDEKDDEDEDEYMDTTFETMKTPFERAIEGNSKVRAVPLMRIYLAKSRIESLRRSISEQTNDLPSKSK